MTASAPPPVATPAPDVHVADNGVATVTLTAGGPLNLFSSPVIRGLTKAMHELAEDEGVRVLVLRGQGERAFCAGADIKEMGALGVNSASVFIDGLRQLIESARLFPAPVIARVPGYCFGGGLELIAGCDIRIGARNAVFAMPEVEIGIPSIIQAALLPRLIGQAHASWLLLTGERINADTAMQWGLLDELVDVEQLDAAVAKRANHMVTFGPKALRQQKRLLREWQTQPLDEAILNGVREFSAAFLTGEPQQHMARFVNKGKA